MRISVSIRITVILKLCESCLSFCRFWLTEYRNTKESRNLAELYKAAIGVPFLVKFVVFVKRQNPSESNLRIFCVTDDKIEKTLENQQQFVVVAQSRDVEVSDGFICHCDQTFSNIVNWGLKKSFFCRRTLS